MEQLEPSYHVKGSGSGQNCFGELASQSFTHMLVTQQLLAPAYTQWKRTYVLTRQMSKFTAALCLSPHWGLHRCLAAEWRDIGHVLHTVGGVRRADESSATACDSVDECPSQCLTEDITRGREVSFHRHKRRPRPSCAVRRLVTGYPWGWAVTGRGRAGSSGGAGDVLFLTQVC